MTIADEVVDALSDGRGVVALESTILAHGLPRPDNRRIGAQIEDAVRACGAVPATVAVLDGVVHVGLEPDALDRLCESVHRGAAQTFDVSADLGVLSRTPVLTVCAGVKSILDVAGTLEYLETLSVPVLGYRTDAFPGFYLTDSGYPVPWRVDTPQEAAAVLLARDQLGADSAGIVLANPLPQDRQVGKDVPPRLLELFHERSGGESLRANVELVLANARLAGEVAEAAADVAAGRG